jgi:DNA-binding XRE family transcriptional regulator
MYVKNPEKKINRPRLVNNGNVRLFIRDKDKDDPYLTDMLDPKRLQISASHPETGYTLVDYQFEIPENVGLIPFGEIRPYPTLGYWALHGFSEGLITPNLSAIRKIRGFSQRELSERLYRHGVDISSSGISRWENVNRAVSYEICMALSKVLNCTVYMLAIPVFTKQQLETALSDKPEVQVKYE